MATTAPNVTAEAGQAEPASGRKRGAGRKMEPFGGAIPMAFLALAVTGLGFWRTFFSQLGNVDVPHMLHGATSTGWLVLVLVQATLVRSRDFRWHRVLGWISVPIFVTLIVSSWHMMAVMMSPGNPLPFEFGKFFLYSDLTALPLLIIAYVAAIVKRKDRHVHSRLVSITLLAGLLPAAARMFNRVFTGMDGLIFSMHPTYLLVLGALGAAIVVDWRNDRLRWPFPFAFVWLLVCYATIFPFSRSEWMGVVGRFIASTA